MERVRRGWRLLAQSAQVLRRDPELVALPLAGAVATLLVAAGLFAAVYRRAPAADDFRGLGLVRLCPVVVVASVPSTFANAALVAGACQRLSGGDPTITDGLRAAWRRFPQLVGWTLLGGIVGLALQLVAERLKVAGPLVRATLGLAWALATFFVIPVLLFEPVGVTDAVRRSARLFRERWGEQATLMGSVGLVFVLATVPVAIVGLLVAAVSPVAGIAYLVVALAAFFAASGALQGVTVAALYHYAVAGDGAGPFQADDLQRAFGPKAVPGSQRRRWWRRRRA